MPNLKAPDEGLSDFYFIEGDEPEAIQDLIVRLVQERIPKRFGFDAKKDIQVLTPMNRSELGARNLNQVLQTALNPGDGGAEVQRFGWDFSHWRSGHPNRELLQPRRIQRRFGRN